MSTVEEARPVTLLVILFFCITPCITMQPDRAVTPVFATPFTTVSGPANMQSMILTNNNELLTMLNEYFSHLLHQNQAFKTELIKELHKIGEKTSEPPPININIESNLSSTAQAVSQLKNETIVQNNTAVAVHNTNIHYQEMANKGYAALTLYGPIIKATIGIAATASFYGWMLWSRKNLHHPLLWSSWHSHKDNDDLRMVPMHNIGYDLIRDAHIRCFDPKNPFSYKATIVQLLAQIHRERKHFKHYYRAARLVKKARLNYLFLLFESDIAEIKRRIDRLSYLEKNLISYITDYSLQHASSFLDYMESKKESLPTERLLS